MSKFYSFLFNGSCPQIDFVKMRFTHMKYYLESEALVLLTSL